MPNLEIFEGKSITWILLMALLLAIWYLAKFTRDFVSNTIIKFEMQLKDQSDTSEKREEQLNIQLNKSIENNTRLAVAIEKIESRFDSLNIQIESIEKRL
jgi:hypothetical protein